MSDSAGLLKRVASVLCTRSTLSRFLSRFLSVIVGALYRGLYSRSRLLLLVIDAESCVWESYAIHCW